MTKAYLEKGWRVIATVRDTSKMPKLEGDIMIVKLEVGEKDDAKKVRSFRFSSFLFLILHVRNSYYLFTEEERDGGLILMLRPSQRSRNKASRRLM